MTQDNNKSLWRRMRGAGLGLMVVVFVAGIVFWGGFNTAMEWTNREAFCISCHEMEENVFKEYRNTIHYSNRSGVRATCWLMSCRLMCSRCLSVSTMAPIMATSRTTPAAWNRYR